MATITLNIPDANINRVTNAVADRYGYSAVLPNGQPNPQTKAAFTKAWLISTIKQAVKEQEGMIAAQTAQNTASADVETNIIIT